MASSRPRGRDTLRPPLGDVDGPTWATGTMRIGAIRFPGCYEKSLGDLIWCSQAWHPTSPKYERTTDNRW